MKVADVYIALVLVGACVAIGYELHKTIAKNDERMTRIERRLRISSASSLPQIAAAVRDDPLLREAYDVISRQMKSESTSHASMVE